MNDSSTALSCPTSHNAKICAACQTTKPISEFYTRACRCKLCTAVYRKIQYRKNPEIARKRVAEWRAEHPEYNREYQAANRDVIRAQRSGYIRQWYAKNREARIAYSKRWRHENPDKAKKLSTEAKIRRRGREVAAPGIFDYDRWMQRVEYHGWRCRYCKVELTVRTLTVDHYKPLSRGGSNWPANLVPACGACNCSKRAIYTPPRQRTFQYMANQLGNLPVTIDTDLVSFGASQTLQTLPFAVRPYKITLVVAAATSSAGTVSITLPIGGAALYPPLVVPAGVAIGTVLFADNPSLPLYWQDFAVTGVTATGTRLFAWYRV